MTRSHWVERPAVRAGLVEGLIELGACEGAHPGYGVEGAGPAASAAASTAEAAAGHGEAV